MICSQELGLEVNKPVRHNRHSVYVTALRPASTAPQHRGVAEIMWHSVLEKTLKKNTMMLIIISHSSKCLGQYRRDSHAGNSPAARLLGRRGKNRHGYTRVQLHLPIPLRLVKRTANIPAVAGSLFPQPAGHTKVTDGSAFAY